MIRFLALCSCIALLFAPAFGQKLDWHFSTDAVNQEELPEDIGSETLEEAVERGLSVFQQAGFLLAYVSRMEQDSASTDIYVDQGEQFKWAELSAGNLPQQIQARVGFRPGRYNLSPVSPNRLRLLFERILRESEQSGFPYARIRLDSIELEGSEVSASILYQSGDRVTFGKLILSDSIFVNPAWLAAYLDIRNGEIYDKREINRLEARLEALDFITLEKSPSLIFRGSKVDVLLNVNKVPSNRVDAVIGFLPNEEEGGGLRITGEAELHIDNLFRSGKTFDLYWQRMRPATQFLSIGYFHSNLFRSNLNLSLDFQFLKEDTTFTTRDFDVRIDYRTGYHTFSALSRFRAARLLNVDPDLEELPEVADFNLNDFGLAYRFGNLKTGWLGYRGIQVTTDVRAGNKNIRRNTAIPAEYYEGIDDNLLQWGMDLSAAWGFLTGRQTLLYQRIRGGLLQSDKLFQNDLYRIGGFRSLRGFNENQFFARQFLLYTIEWQLYFDQSSHLMVFVDQAFMKFLDGGDHPTGAGVGLTLQTGNGLLQLAYAVGRTNNQPFDLRLSKFHFGYKAKF